MKKGLYRANFMTGQWAAPYEHKDDEHNFKLIFAPQMLLEFGFPAGTPLAARRTFVDGRKKDDEMLMSLEPRRRGTCRL